MWMNTSLDTARGTARYRVCGKAEAKQRDEEEEEGNAAKAAKDLGALSAVEGAKHAVSH